MPSTRCGSSSPSRRSSPSSSENCAAPGDGRLLEPRVELREGVRRAPTRRGRAGRERDSAASSPSQTNGSRVKRSARSRSAGVGADVAWSATGVDSAKKAEAIGVEESRGHGARLREKLTGSRSSGRRCGRAPSVSAARECSLLKQTRPGDSARVPPWDACAGPCRSSPQPRLVAVARHRSHAGGRRRRTTPGQEGRRPSTSRPRASACRAARAAGRAARAVQRAARRRQERVRGAPARAARPSRRRQQVGLVVRALPRRVPDPAERGHRARPRDRVPRRRRAGQAPGRRRLPGESSLCPTRPTRTPTRRSRARSRRPPTSRSRCSSTPKGKTVFIHQGGYRSAPS